MKNKSKIKFTDLSSKAEKPVIKPLSDAETAEVVGGDRDPGGGCGPGMPCMPEKFKKYLK